MIGHWWCFVTAILIVILQVKTDEYTMHKFHIIKYCHLNHFGSTLGLAGLAVVWQVASQTPYDLHISATVFKVTHRKEKTTPCNNPLQTYLSTMLYSTNKTSIAGAEPAPHLHISATVFKVTLCG